MIKVDDNTPLAVITVGQFLELIEEKTQSKEPEQREDPKEDRTGIDEISEMTGLSKSAIYKLSMKNEIPHRKFGKRLIFSRSEVKDWLEQQTVGKVTRQQKAARRLASLAAKRAKKG
jgi:excisionase family DNA binding protein